MIKKLKFKLLNSEIQRLVHKRLKNRDVTITTLNQILKTHQFRGVRFFGKMLLIEKDVLLEMEQNYKSSDFSRLFFEIYGSDRGIGYSSSLAKIALKSNCIIVVHNEQRSRYMEHYMADVVRHGFNRTNIFKILLCRWFGGYYF